MHFSEHVEHVEGDRDLEIYAYAGLIASRGMPYSPDAASDAAKLNDVEISRRECAPGLDAELNKVQQGYALQSFLGFLVKLSGVPVSEASFRELGRAYMCGPGGQICGVGLCQFYP